MKKNNNNNNNVFGPVSQQDWLEMRTIVSSLNFYKEKTDKDKFKDAILLEEKFLRELKSKYNPLGSSMRKTEENKTERRVA
jgi:hypothetical protein